MENTFWWWSILKQFINENYIRWKIKMCNFGHEMHLHTSIFSYVEHTQIDITHQTQPGEIESQSFALQPIIDSSQV